MCLLQVQVCVMVIGDIRRLDHGYRDLRIRRYVLCISYWSFAVVYRYVCMLSIVDVIDEILIQVFMRIR